MESAQQELEVSEILVNKKVNIVVGKKLVKVHSKKKIVRRGGKHVDNKITKLKVLSTNSQGDKFASLASLVRIKGASILMIQETHSRKKGKH